MAESQLMLTDAEHAFLVEFLERALKEARIEEHRTRTPSYRQHVLKDEDVIVSLLNKLGRPGK